MDNDPYKSPESKVENESGNGNTRYRNYTDVPLYRRQWFFWLTYFLIAPVGLAILIFGDIYYVKKGRVVAFGIANRIVAGILALVFIFNSLPRLLGI